MAVQQAAKTKYYSGIVPQKERFVKMAEEFRSRVYTDRPAYADFDAPAKFQAIMSIIAKRLTEHPKAICSYSGGADSDIMLDLIERTREAFTASNI